MKIIKATGKILVGILTILLVFFSWMYFSSYSPGDLEKEKVVCLAEAPALRPGQSIKALVWNIQYLASKNYVFFYDLPASDGPDVFPSQEHLDWTLSEVVRVIKAENPDVILFQEVHENARQTYNVDQLDLLVKELGKDYPCFADSLYWKAPFVPHPKIMGSVGMKLATFSRYKMTEAIRHALPPIPADPLSERLGFHRAILATHIDIEGSDKDFVALNTHMDAFSQGTTIMEEQVGIARKTADDLQKNGHAWILGGDFNLLPPDWKRQQLHPDVQDYYNEKTEITPLFEAFPSAASRSELNGPNQARFYTHIPNNPKIPGLDRTIDYIFYSPSLALKNYQVRQNDTQKISDHLPLVGQFQLSGNSK